jgi:Ni2+-binding GTPase involved in maturation of urease and hydrogenase
MTAAAKRRTILAFHAANNEDLGAVTKQDLREAVDAVDAYMDSQAATFRAQLPTETRNALTAAQERRLIRAIMNERYN